MKKNKKHIIVSEMLDKNGKWKPKAQAIARDADKVLASFISKHAGKVSLCSLQSIISCSIDHQITMARLKS